MDTEVSHLDYEIAKENLQEGVEKIVTVLRPKWNIKQVTSEEKSTGYINTNYALLHQNSPKDGLFLRIVSMKLPEQMNRCVNNMKYLKRRNFGAQLLLTFKNGIVMEFLEGETIGWDDMERAKEPKIWASIAREMARYHVSTNWDDVRKYNIPDIEDLVEKYMQLAHHVYYNSGTVTDEQKKYLPTPEDLRETRKRVLDVVKKYKIQKVYCHTDSNPSNLLIRGDDVVFVDYDDCCVDFPPWEIARLFTVFPGLAVVDFSKLPTQEQQVAFVREYLNSRSSLDPDFGPVTEKTVDLWMFLIRKLFLLYWSDGSCANWLFHFMSDKPIDPKASEKFWGRYLETQQEVMDETFDIE